jgi:hypothetical protein
MNQLVAFTDRAPALIAAAGARASYRFLLGGIAALRRRGPGPVPGGRSEGRRPENSISCSYFPFSKCPCSSAIVWAIDRTRASRPRGSGPR